jgi:hypothetical protein
MDVGEINCEPAEWTELSRVMVVSTSCESSFKSSGSQMTVRFRLAEKLTASQEEPNWVKIGVLHEKFMIRHRRGC